MKCADNRPFANPANAARKALEIASTVEAAQDGRIHIEKINGPFIPNDSGSPTEYKAGLDLAIPKGCGVRGGTVRGQTRRLRHMAGPIRRTLALPGEANKRTGGPARGCSESTS